MVHLYGLAFYMVRLNSEPFRVRLPCPSRWKKREVLFSDRPSEEADFFEEKSSCPPRAILKSDRPDQPFKLIRPRASVEIDVPADRWANFP